MTNKQIAAAFRKAPPHSQFTLEYGSKQVRESYQSDVLVWRIETIRYITREAAKRIAADKPVFKIIHHVVRPLKVVSMPAIFNNCLD